MVKQDEIWYWLVNNYLWRLTCGQLTYARKLVNNSRKYISYPNELKIQDHLKYVTDFWINWNVTC